MAGPVWLDRDLVIALYEDIVAASGGAFGVRDEGLLDSALARPINRAAYEGCNDFVELAATYAVASSGNHPFIDGNKRVAFIAMALFLEDNGLKLVATNGDATRAILSMAAGEADLPAFVNWLRTFVETVA